MRIRPEILGNVIFIIIFVFVRTLRAEAEDWSGPDVERSRFERLVACLVAVRKTEAAQKNIQNSSRKFGKRHFYHYFRVRAHFEG